MVKEVRADLGKPVEPWIERLKPEQREIAATFHRLVRSAAPSIESSLKWGMPFYTKDGMLGGIMVAKKHVSLFFVKGARLEDPKKILTGSGKGMRAVRVTSSKEIPAAAVKAL